MTHLRYVSEFLHEVKNLELRFLCVELFQEMLMFYPCHSSVFTIYHSITRLDSRIVFRFLLPSAGEVAEYLLHYGTQEGK